MRKVPRNAVIAIGVFDGVHRGHQQVIRRAVDEARRLKGPSIVMTFHPHPVFVLHPRKFSAYVLPLSQRLKFFKSLGVDICVVVNFTKAFSAVSPEHFLKGYLVKKFKPVKVVVGQDFHFGHGGAGAISLLRESGARYGFDVESVPLLKHKNTNIKTTNLKNLISAGDLRAIKVFLGRNYSMGGRVIHGDGRGRKLGFPTANLKKENVTILPPGIYFIRAHFSGRKRNGLFYIGRRPSIKRGGGQVHLEAYLLDFQGNLYHREIEVEFLKKYRNETMFSDEKSLVSQIKKDIHAARLFFKRKIF
ncbi:MAG: bifunctional riboflavin kinase/FAD synthetase [Candidatus Omnitrophica bacterium]|nr:bifunctional riboflavin kinase/FAD synthetase [Candidatus Omnitrophota bacterium]